MSTRKWTKRDEAWYAAQDGGIKAALMAVHGTSYGLACRVAHLGLLGQDDPAVLVELEQMAGKPRLMGDGAIWRHPTPEEAARLLAAVKPYYLHDRLVRARYAARYGTD